MKDHNKTMLNVKDVEAGMKKFGHKEKFKKSCHAILGYFDLINDQEFKTYMLIDHSLWIHVCMFAEDEPHIPIMEEKEIKFTAREIRNQIIETYGKIRYYSTVKGHVDVHLEPVKDHFKICIDYLNDLMGVGMDGD